MVELKCPYSELELNIAMLKLNNSLTEEMADEIATEVENILGKRATTPAEFNLAVAKHNGITLEQLVNSPNMEYLVTSFRQYAVNTIFSVLRRKGLSELEVWAVISYLVKADI